MKHEYRKQEIANALRRLATTYAQTIRQFEETLADLCREFDLTEIGCVELMPQPRVLDPPKRRRGDPAADRATLTVHWQGHACFLGNTLLFRFFEELAARPNRYFPLSELLDAVWAGPRSPVSIRNVVKRLRDRLSRAGMHQVAKAIDGSVKGHYALRTDRLK